MTCLGSQTPLRPLTARPNDVRVVAFPLVRTGAARERGDFGAPWLACLILPTDAQDDVVTVVAPPLEAEVIGYNFFAGLFHSLS